MGVTPQSVGSYLEAQTTKKLRQEGFSIVARNRKICGVEIDIIARKNNSGEEHYYFIECKYRHEDTAFPLVSRKQRERYRKAAAFWQSELGRFLNLHLSVAIGTGNSESIHLIADYF